MRDPLTPTDIADGPVGRWRNLSWKEQRSILVLVAFLLFSVIGFAVFIGFRSSVHWARVTVDGNSGACGSESVSVLVNNNSDLTLVRVAGRLMRRTGTGRHRGEDIIGSFDLDRILPPHASFSVCVDAGAVARSGVDIRTADWRADITLAQTAAELKGHPR